MNTIIKLARRNIWRNKRRTLITAMAIFFAVFFSVVMQSVQKGMFDNMEFGMVKSFVGFGQIHSKGFFEDQTLDNAFLYDEKIDELANKHKDVKAFVPRIESFALASNGQATKGAMLIGIDTEKENTLTELSQKITKGEYFVPNDSSVLVAEGLAKYLKVDVGDTLVLISSGYHGASAAGAYLVKGLIQFPSPELNNRMIYMPLATSQEFFDANGLVTTLVIDTDKPNRIEKITSQLQAGLGEEYEVMPFVELIPNIIQVRQFKEGSSLFMLFILYAIITFGIFGTILMMIKERQYEFGVLTAIGLRRSRLSMIVWLETIFIGMIGVVAGVAASLGITYFLKMNPVALTGEAAAAYEDFGIEPLITASTAPEIFYNQAIIVFVIVTLLALYPIFKISKLKPVEAMRA
jgi:ABC-type lipoprotein release transport system permease subunit